MILEPWAEECFELFDGFDDEPSFALLPYKPHIERLQIINVSAICLALVHPEINREINYDHLRLSGNR